MEQDLPTAWLPQGFPFSDRFPCGRTIQKQGSKLRQMGIQVSLVENSKHYKSKSLS